MHTDALRAQWVQTNGPYGGNVSAFARNGPYLFAATDAGVYRSDNNGTTWVIENNGMMNGNSVYSLTTMGTVLFAGTAYYGVFLSMDNGEHWSQTNSATYPSGLGGTGSVEALTSIGTYLYVGASGVLFRSNDSGSTWTSISPKSTSYYITSFAVSGTNLFVGIEGEGIGEPGGVFRSSDNGNSWTAASTELGNRDIWALAADSDANLYTCTIDTLFRSTDHGVTWMKASTKLPGEDVHSIIIDGSNIFVSMYNTGVFRSTDNGTSWTASTAGITNPNILTLFVSGKSLFAGTNGAGVFESIDSGAHWTAINEGIVSTSISALIANGGSVIAAVDGEGIFRTTDDGASWTNSGLANTNVLTFNNMGHILFAGTDSGVFRSSDNGTSWALANSGISGQYLGVLSLAVIGTNLFAGTANGIPVFRSTDSGASWAPASSGLSHDITSLAVLGTQLFAGTKNQGIFRSTDSGASWTLASKGIPGGSNAAYPKIIGLTVFGTKILEIGGGIFRSTDSGASWTTAGAGIYGNIEQLVTFDSYLFLSAGYNGVYFSTDTGTSWAFDTIGLMNNNAVALAVNGKNLFAGTGNGVWHCPAIPPYILSASADTLNFGNIPAGSDSLRIMTVYDVGNLPLTIRFFQVPPGQNSFVTSDLSSPVYLLPGESFTFEVYFQPLEVGRFSATLEITSEANRVNVTFTGRAFAEDEVTQQPVRNTLLTLYPNPLSQSTTLYFTPQASGYADVSIVNLLGAEVAHLLSGELAAGEHSFVWSKPTGLPDGMYECIVRMNGQVEAVPVVVR
jgi:photosystem II stability/assembly factor-like uncharacterized protein